MTEAQYMTLLIGLAITVRANLTVALAALLINNSQLSDVRDSLRAEIEAKAAHSDSRISQSRESILTQMATCQMDVISKIAELDNRITLLER